MPSFPRLVSSIKQTYLKSTVFIDTCYYKKVSVLHSFVAQQVLVDFLHLNFTQKGALNIVVSVPILRCEKVQIKYASLFASFGNLKKKPSLGKSNPDLARWLYKTVHLDHQKMHKVHSLKLLILAQALIFKCITQLILTEQYLCTTSTHTNFKFLNENSDCQISAPPLPSHLPCKSVTIS